MIFLLFFLHKTAIFVTHTTNSYQNLHDLNNHNDILNLGENNFNRSILKSLSAIKSLKNLNLSQNALIGSFPAQELSALENLEKLDLSGNHLYGSLTTQGNEREYHCNF
ncbi:hypothetical protein ACB098_09G097400 [Castanea mollissima]